ncbi:DUF1622 domain-containing protein [Altererythrobacter sp. Root672]|uniref:DUF1622 domain-containing protein n=1 Tax=Altererythrobacter sp. Root672 TaxID=1736584 RepID=UPI0006F4596D|nr:DUF1622 domain-containing protein [Altererythrobacter sp. Root672]KRA83886.1 hypothetical protein ASD76_07720 [Altererythrobacter sp. Root672]
MDWVEPTAEIVASGLEFIMLVVIVIGTLRALKSVVAHVIKREALAADVRRIWLHYAGWIVLALEFALAADLIGTMIQPTWDDIGQLAAIGAIRTALAWFLSRDIEEFSHEPEAKEERA